MHAHLIRDLKVACLLSALLLAAAPAALGAGSTDETARVLHGVQTWLDATTTLEGPFEQSLVSGALGGGLVESGRLYIRRPGKMRWEYTEPESKIAILDGDRTTLYVALDQQLLLGRLGDQGDLLPTLLAGEGRISELFDVSLVARPEGQADVDGLFRLRLEPRPATDALEAVILTTRAPAYAIEMAEVLDAGGNRMLYRFGKLRRNRPLPDDLFRFEPPPGTVIEGAHGP